MKRGILGDKKAEGILDYHMVWFVIVAMFFLGLLYFVYDSASGAIVYEQSYAKEIALLIDVAGPNTEIKLNFSEGFRIAEENGKISGLASIEESSVRVNLGNRAGYSAQYFSDYDITLYEDKKENLIVIFLEEKVGEFSGGQNGV